MNAETLEYIREHANDDVRQLALRPAPTEVDLRAALIQIEGRQLAARKLPTWAATDGLLFPPRLALEQCSSETTAHYKRQVLENFSALNPQPSQSSTFTDLTGGFGVDFAVIAPLFSRAVYIEQQEALCDIARHNMPLLGLPKAEVHCTTAQDVLQDLDTHCLMIDPARRDASGNKVARIEDCAPDVCALQEQLRASANITLIKLSPMLDLTAALRSLNGIVESHVVSVEGECKELLLLMRGNTSSAAVPAPDDCPIHCVDLKSTQATPSVFIFTRTVEAASPLILADSIGTYLYEPNASILKAGAYKTICQRFSVQKLAADTHFYTSNHLVAGFPGRRWRVADSATFAKRDLRRLLQNTSAADLTVRGFPTSVATLRKQLRLREGGTSHFIATTLADGSRHLIRVERT